MDNKILASKLYFAKEAADYLNISVQRLNRLVRDGKITPLKKNNSGTIFHVDELKHRKDELEIFSENRASIEIGTFQIDTRVKQEALNYATLLEIIGCTEKSLEPRFIEFSKNVNVTIPMIDESVIKDYVYFFEIQEYELRKKYDFAWKKFSTLRSTDEILKRGEPDYPPLLMKTEQAPRFLYIRGNKALLYEKRTVALVGSRNASEDAKNRTGTLAATLGKNGITIVSGLARGIDVTAHRAALANGFNTIAVIGTNLNYYYPPENKTVQEEIEKKGLVVSQFSPVATTQRWFFPLRNGVMSGLSLATVIMEAGETSGALRQADFALKQGRQIMIPEDALKIKTITWPQRYVKKGAETVSTANDIIRKLAESNIFKPEQVDEAIQTSFGDYLTNSTRISKQNGNENAVYKDLGELDCLDI